MKLAVVSAEMQKDIRKEYGREDHRIAHLLLAYQTIFDHACDPDADTLEFKPELLNQKARLEAAETEITELKRNLKNVEERYQQLSRHHNEKCTCTAIV